VGLQEQHWHPGHCTDGGIYSENMWQHAKLYDETLSQSLLPGLIQEAILRCNQLLQVNI
jgi:hypothetical protein